jgi:heterotetrameric sarcosine oxidase gamma subunit
VKTNTDSKQLYDVPAGEWQELVQYSTDTPLKQAGISSRRFSSSNLELKELTGTALISIKSLLPFNSLQTQIAACDIPLPEKVNQVLGQDPAVIGSAPGEWLIFSEFIRAGQLLDQILPATDSPHTLVTDLSASLAVYRLSGNTVPWLLNKLCGLDFQAGASAPTHSVRTRLQEAAVRLQYHKPGHTNKYVFNVIFDRSIAIYIWDLLIASAPHAEELNQQYGTTS